MEEIKALLREVERDNNAQYRTEWEARAVEALNAWNLDERKDWDAFVYNANSEEFEDMVRGQLEARGWCGLKYFLQNVSTTADWVRLDGYGNGEEVTGSDMVEMLKDALQEIEDE